MGENGVLDIGTRIWKARRDAGLTQQLLADHVITTPKLTRAVLIAIERDRATPSEELAQAILDAIDRLKVKP